jgi:hypothetical protein
MTPIMIQAVRFTVAKCVAVPVCSAAVKRAVAASFQVRNRICPRLATE